MYHEADDDGNRIICCGPPIAEHLPESDILEKNREINTDAVETDDDAKVDPIWTSRTLDNDVNDGWSIMT